MEKFINSKWLTVILIVFFIGVVVYMKMNKPKETIWFYSVLIYRADESKEARSSTCKVIGENDEGLYGLLVDYMKKKHKIKDDPFVVTCITRLTD